MEMLTDFKEVKRKQRVNGEHSLSFYLLNTDRVKHAYNLVNERSVVILGDDEYIVSNINKRGHYGKSVYARHIFFEDLMDWEYTTKTGSLNFVQCMNFIFSETGWKWINQGAFTAVQFENFGDDTRLSLLQKALNSYKAEMKIDNKNKTVTFKNQIGVQTDAQFRYGHNLKTYEEDIDTSNFTTYIKGFSKDAAGKEIEVEYESKMSVIYGRIHQKPIRDERYKSKETLLDACKKSLNDVFDIRFKVSVANLLENGLSPLHKFGLGDYVYMIYEEADVKVQIRVIEIEDDPTDITKSPTVELSTFKELRTMSAIQAQFQQTQKQVQHLLDDGGNLNLALKRLYMNTETFADNTGVWYVDPEDGNRYVHIGSGGLDVHRGLIRVERDDGYATIIGGILQHGFDISGHEPPFTDVETISYWWATDKNEYGNCQYYSFEHKSRYLMVLIGQFVDDGASSQVSVVSNDGQTVLGTLTSTNTNQQADEAKYGRILAIDLGVPTGQEMSVYIRLKSSVVGKKAYCRKLRMWLER